MASYIHFYSLFSLFFLTNAMVLKVTKDPSTLQYLTRIHKGTPIAPTKLVLDLGGPFLWEACHVSSSHKPIHSTSLQCSMAKPNSSYNCFSKTCDLPIVNPIARSTTRGELVEDIVAVDHDDHTGLRLGSISTVQNFVFVCAPPWLLNGLASGAKGMLGFGRTRIAVPSQVVVNRRFSVCISSSDGVISSADDHLNFSILGSEIWGSLSYTPMIRNKISTLGEYYINLSSIKVNNRRISINPVLLSRGAKLSTVVPYTTMESSIYNTFTSAYVSAATAMNMTRVAARPPFGVCFGSVGVGETIAGPTVPVIDFVLQSEMVTWRFYGRNSMVHVGDDVMCLGVLDGGVGTSDGFVIVGGCQLEDHLLEFDLGTSMLGFSSSLLMKQTSCSKFKFSTKDSGRLI